MRILTYCRTRSDVVNTDLNVLPIETFTYFASLFLVPPQNEHSQEFRRVGFHNTSPFMSSVQRGDRRRPFGFRMQANNFVIWQMKAGQVLEKASRLKFKDTTGFPLHRATGWIGNSDKSEGFYFREWFCTICVYTRRKAGTATGLVLSWIDDKPHYLSHAEDWRNKYIEDCGYDGATYTFFIRKVFWACTLWHELWIKTLDEIDLLINVQVRIISRVFESCVLLSWLSGHFQIESYFAS